IVFWTFGSLSGSDWQNIPIVLVMFVVVFILIYRKAWFLTAMKLGDSKAAALGIDTNKIRKWMFVAISLLTATCVAFVGCIGFIGIVG
ncbi:iron chelate uptake ABC transporter family permease subunit, partial [Klebsiella pneumoniae]|uniref:iron chelate uptake ABC transporter family permease subunit n=1 Tax=Klebsiella pneumoniae TaxID=573 RepID=UPI0025A26F85